MKPELTQTEKLGETTRELFLLPCGSRLQKDSTPNPVQGTPSVRYQLRGRYATNKTIELLLAQIEGIPEGIPADAAGHLSTHYVATALIHRARRNPSTVRKLEAEAATALAMWQKAQRKEMKRAEQENRRAVLESVGPEAERYVKLFEDNGFRGVWELLGGEGEKGELARVSGHRQTATHHELATVCITRHGNVFAWNGQMISKVEFLTRIGERKKRAEPSAQPELPGMVRVEMQQDDAQAAAADLQALVDYACGSTGMTGQTLARAVRGGLELLGKLKAGLQ